MVIAGEMVLYTVGWLLQEKDHEVSDPQHYTVNLLLQQSPQYQLVSASAGVVVPRWKQSAGCNLQLLDVPSVLDLVV